MHHKDESQVGGVCLNWDDGGVALLYNDKVWRGHLGMRDSGWVKETVFEEENGKEVRGQDIREIISMGISIKFKIRVA